ncbi:MAG TPA: DegT/DnrJ/EryC1/StrS family aminotransferase [Armatimonadota bacterium]|nr:DegT/DnrJ/EryC1/StrS family aminotransferase [Armatimonadota bacterium]
MRVPIADLRAQYQSIKREMDDAVQAVMAGSAFILGPSVKALEERIAEYSGAAYGVGVNSGTDALLLALAAIGIGPGDEVITTPFTFVATTEVIAVLGARPVYADIEAETFNLDPKRIEEKITPRTNAILPVHLYGQAADVTRISEVAKRHGLRVIYDGAQAIGAMAHGRPIGAYGDAVTLSFFPTKNLGAAGDGGMVLTNDAELAEKLRFLRFHGSGGAYSYKHVGYCSRLDEIQAAILLAKLPHLDAWTELRRANAETYRCLLSDLDIVLPKEQPFNKHVYHQYTIRHRERDQLRQLLKSKEIDTGVYYPNPLHFEEAYRYLGYKPGDLPEAERACREVLSLPVFPGLTEQQLAHVACSIRSFCEQT